MASKDKRRAKNLRQRERASSRQAAMLKRLGDQVYADKATHEEALKAAEFRGYKEALHECINVVQAAKTITTARKSLDAKAANFLEDNDGT